MAVQDVLRILNEIREGIQDVPGGMVDKSFLLEFLDGKEDEVRENGRKERERLEKLLKQAADAAGRTEPIPVRTYTKLEDLSVGDRVKACDTAGTRIPAYLECQPMTVTGFTRAGNVKCDLGDGGKPYHIHPSMLIKVG